MPYFHNNYVNLLFIHIPKTGGSSLETYFSKKFNMPLNDSTLFNIVKRFKGVSLQHQTYQSLITYPQIFKIDNNNLKILTVVRSPYHRLISDLFHFKYITTNSSQAFVFKVLATKYFNTFGANDNHKKPQYLFLLDKDGKMLEENITILRMETLNADMAKLGYTDFNIVANKNISNFINLDMSGSSDKFLLAISNSVISSGNETKYFLIVNVVIYIFVFCILNDNI